MHVFAAEQMAEPNDERATKLVRVLVWVIYGCAGIAIKVIVNEQSATQLFSLIHGIGGFFVFLCIFYKGTIWGKLMIALAVFFGTSLSEILLLVVIPRAELASMTEWNMQNIQIMMMTGLGAVLSSIGIWLVIVVWKRAFKKVKTPKHAYIFCIYAFFQTFSFSKIHYLVEDGVTNLSVYYSMLSTIICGVCLAVVIFYELQKQEVQRIFQEVTEKRELENTYLNEVMAKRRELADITREHDFLLERIEAELSKDHQDNAELLLQDFLKRIDDTREYPYCGIPLVNVILSEKQKVCAENGIRLDIDLKITDEINISQVDLCSAFTNVLDNAIRGCRFITDKCAEANPVITLRAGNAGDYLVIKCENTYIPGMGRFHEGSGLGLKILADIAERYQGNLKAEGLGDLYRIQLSMRKCR